MSFAQGAPTQPLVLQGSNVFLYGSSTSGNAFTVQQLSAGNVASFQTLTNATAMMINPAGNVGIGTTNPYGKFDILGGVLFHSNATTLSHGAISMSNGEFLSLEAFNSGNTGKLPIALCAYGGNVGIGTTNPGALFQVNAAVTNPTIPTVHIGDNSNDYGAIYGMVHLTRNATPGDTKAHLSIIRNGNTGVNFGFWNNTNTFGIWAGLGNTGTTPTFSITTGGNVGIGTTSTTSNLFVYHAVASPTVPMVSIGNVIGYGAGNGDQTVLSGLYTSLGNTNNIVQQIGKSNDTNSFFYGYQHNTGSPYFWIARYGVSNTSFTVNANGVGIGATHTDTGFKMTVSNGDSSYTLYGPNSTWGSYLYVGAGVNRIAAGRAAVITTNGNLHLDCGGGNRDMYLNFYAGGDGVGAPIRSYGTIYNSGDIFAYYSDERLKTKVGSIENALDKVCSLSAFKYVHNEIAKRYGYEGDEIQVGLSAQEVRKILPEVVGPAPFDMGTEYDVGKGNSRTGQNYLTLKYERIVPLLVEALKEERQKREDVTCELRSLEERIKLLEQK